APSVTLSLHDALPICEDRLIVSATRLPGTLWNMVVFVSIVVFGGFLVLGVHALWLSLLMVAAVAGSVTFLLSTLKDMDNPFVGRSEEHTSELQSRVDL